MFCTANILYLHHCSMYAKKCYLLDLKQNILCIYNANVFLDTKQIHLRFIFEYLFYLFVLFGCNMNLDWTKVEFVFSHFCLYFWWFFKVSFRRALLWKIIKHFALKAFHTFCSTQNSNIKAISKTPITIIYKGADQG